MSYFEVLKNKILTGIVVNKEDEKIVFTTKDNKKYKMYHYSECCEDVYIDDICGDIKDLLNTPVLLAEVVTNVDQNPVGCKIPDDQESFTWTFYKLSTIKGSVTFRWYGGSNGYYSEDVDFEEYDE